MGRRRNRHKSSGSRRHVPRHSAVVRIRPAGVRRAWSSRADILLHRIKAVFWRLQGHPRRFRGVCPLAFRTASVPFNDTSISFGRTTAANAAPRGGMNSKHEPVIIIRRRTRNTPHGAVEIGLRRLRDGDDGCFL